MKINKVIRDCGQTTLIEVQLPARGAVRVYVPSDTLRGEYIDEFDAVSGIEYGLPWEEVLERILPEEAAQKLAGLLRDSHIYTANEAHSAISQIAAILQGFWLADANRIIALALRFGVKGETK
jgi:hypothetical protein